MLCVFVACMFFLLPLRALRWRRNHAVVFEKIASKGVRSAHAAPVLLEALWLNHWPMTVVTIAALWVGDPERLSPYSSAGGC